jgi:DNA-binding response OmpR family regulator
MNRTILLVEDSEDDVFFMKRALKHAGIANPVQVVSDGQAALDYLAGQNGFSDRDQFPVPSLVLLDLRLPLVPGMEVLKWIRSESQLTGLPVIVLTSSKHDMDVASAYSLGANAFLVKPSDSKELVSMVKAIGDFWLIYNHAPVFGSPVLSVSHV